jgi:hypothetical protein
MNYLSIVDSRKNSHHLLINGRYPASLKMRYYLRDDSKKFFCKVSAAAFSPPRHQCIAADHRQRAVGFRPFYNNSFMPPRKFRGALSIAERIVYRNLQGNLFSKNQPVPTPQ